MASKDTQEMGQEATQKAAQKATREAAQDIAHDGEEMVPDLTAVTAAVRELLHAGRELTNRVARQAGRSATDTTALGLLDMLGPLSPVDLATHLGIRTASATVLVDRLEEAGDVMRVRHASDRRRVVVHLTEATRAREREVWTPIVADLDRVTRTLSAPEQEVVRAYLSDLVEVLSAHPSAPRPQA